MRSFIKNYVKGCGTCQQFKINRNPSNPSYNPVPGPVTTRPFANCSMDLITDLPLITLENRTIIDALLVVVDHGLTKGVVITPVSKTLTEEGAGEILLNQFYKRFGLPDSIISDRDPRFTAWAFQELLWLLGIKSKLTTAFLGLCTIAVNRWLYGRLWRVTTCTVRASTAPSDRLVDQCVHTVEPVRLEPFMAIIRVYFFCNTYITIKHMNNNWCSQVWCLGIVHPK